MIPKQNCIPGTPFRNKFEYYLYKWAAQCLPAACDMIEANWLNPEIVRACCGRIFKRIVELYDNQYVRRCAEEIPDELLLLAPYIGELKMPLCGMMPGELGWPAWIKELRDTMGMFSHLSVATSTVAVATVTPELEKAVA